MCNQSKQRASKSKENYPDTVWCHHYLGVPCHCEPVMEKQGTKNSTRVMILLRLGRGKIFMVTEVQICVSKGWNYTVRSQQTNKEKKKNEKRKENDLLSAFQRNFSTLPLEK